MHGRLWPSLADCARLDHAVHQCEHAIDADFDAGSITLLGSTDPSQLHLDFLPGTALIKSMWPLALILEAHARPNGFAREMLLTQIRIAQERPRACAALVCRDGWRALVTPVAEHEVSGRARFQQGNHSPMRCCGPTRLSTSLPG